jgi:hypothetical protein
MEELGAHSSILFVESQSKGNTVILQNTWYGEQEHLKVNVPELAK